MVTNVNREAFRHYYGDSSAARVAPIERAMIPDLTELLDKRRNKRGDGSPAGPASGKTTVVGAVQRRGNVVARVIGTADTQTLEGFTAEAVSNKVSLIEYDDNHGATAGLARNIRTFCALTLQAANMLLVRFTPTRLKASGRSSNAGSSAARSQGERKNTCRFTLPNFSSATTNRDNPDIFGGRDSRLLRRGHWSPSQLEKKEASKSELEQLELPF